MERCVIYARVSTKEQAEEGYSLAAQMKACEGFARAQKLFVAERFTEAAGAGKVGHRPQFMAMLAYLDAHTEVRTVVVHKLDRLARNFMDPEELKERGVRVRYVEGDMPDTPEGELMEDVGRSFSKYYLANLSREVRKGMDEKVIQGGWPHLAPLGYLNDKNTRSVVVDESKAGLVRHAFERYASGSVSLDDLADELYSMGLRSRRGNRIRPEALRNILQNPFYCGLMLQKGVLHKGAHEPLVSSELFEKVKDAFEPNRHKHQHQAHIYTLRDFLYCEECGCKVTAGTHKGHVYYRCTHGKGRGSCSQNAYVREEQLAEQVEFILSRIELDPELAEALAVEAEVLEEQRVSQQGERVASVSRALEANARRSSKLLDALLDGAIAQEVYQAKENELTSERATLELRLAELQASASPTTSKVRDLLAFATGARVAFTEGDQAAQRMVLERVLCNATVQDGRIASYQYKRPFGVLTKDASGALEHSWWAI